MLTFLRLDYRNSLLIILYLIVLGIIIPISKNVRKFAYTNLEIENTIKAEFFNFQNLNNFNLL